ncbi:hypothetical protein O8C83_06040 [Aliarcobacter butzleri]|uniref:hypothetical protein n=1 Tax=Aliarcobacter butzleri TaxID=28197 RepID=UPI00263C406D|nr:hypothetical protein [Aliarcobacter butzleri]MDN5100378.1 hypothetical protein [Aliarcobacter butzleri]
MINQINCPICNISSKEESTGRDGHHIICPKCGEYFISRSLKINLRSIENIKDINKISSWISEQNKLFGNIPELLTSNIEAIIDQREKTIKEKFDCFMKTISTLDQGQITNLNFNHCYIYDENELGTFYQKALDKNYIKGLLKQPMGHIPLIMHQSICFDGLEYVESLNQKNENSKNVFAAFYFTKELQSIFDNDVKQIIEELELTYIRVSSSTTDTNTTINDDIIGKIKSSKIVIADFSGQRNSVYFEAGFAMGLNIPVIWTCKKSEVDNLSFDTRQYPHILWETKEELKEKLKNRIKAIS